MNHSAGNPPASATEAAGVHTLAVKIATLTPLWASSNKSDCDRIGPGFILDSLRWWYESLVRGLGGAACDPSGEERCRQPAPSAGGETTICSACSLFGSAETPGKIRLEISEETTPVFRSAEGEPLRIVAGGKGKSARLGPGLVGQADLRFTLLPSGRVSAADLRATLKVLLKFVERWGAMGARAHIGYGVVRISDEAGVALAVTAEEVERFIATATRGRGTTAAAAAFPDLASSLLAKVPLTIGDRSRFDGSQTPEQADKLAQWRDNHASVPLAPSLRKQLRSRGRSSRDTEPNHLFACTTNFRRGTFLGSSFAYRNDSTGADRYELRLWIHYGPDHLGEVDLMAEALQQAETWAAVLDDENGERNRADLSSIVIKRLDDRDAVRQLLDSLV